MHALGVHDVVRWHMLCGGVLPTDRLNHPRAVVRSAEIGLTTGSGGRKQPKHHREDQNRCRVNRPRMAVRKIRLMNQHATMKPRMIPNATSIGLKAFPLIAMAAR